MGARGDADLVLSHEPETEQRLLAERGLGHSHEAGSPVSLYAGPEDVHLLDP